MIPWIQTNKLKVNKGIILLHYWCLKLEDVVSQFCFAASMQNSSLMGGSIIVIRGWSNISRKILMNGWSLDDSFPNFDWWRYDSTSTFPLWLNSIYIVSIQQQFSLSSPYCPMSCLWCIYCFVSQSAFSLMFSFRVGVGVGVGGRWKVDNWRFTE